LYEGRLYGFDLKEAQSRLDRPSRGAFRCLDFETGRVNWSTDRVGQASAIVADGKLILFNDSGELILAKLGTDEYVELARAQVFHDETCWTSPALHRGCVYLRTQSRAVCVYLGAAPLHNTQSVRSVNDIPRGLSLTAKKLIGGERDFPATVPEWSEFGVWYAWSVAAIALATLIVFSLQSLKAVLEWMLGRNCSGRAADATTLTEKDRRIDQPALPSFASGTVFWLLLLFEGLIGSPIINAYQSEYVLLWPLALWGTFQATFNVIHVTEHHNDRRRLRWYSRGCVVAFLSVCTLYFTLCRQFGYAIEWSFLVGFLPAFPLAAVAARFMTGRHKLWSLIIFLCSLISFSAYFWSSVAFIKWKLVVGS
jgi:hypothetical protein